MYKNEEQYKKLPKFLFFVAVSKSCDVSSFYLFILQHPLARLCSIQDYELQIILKASNYSVEY